MHIVYLIQLFPYQIQLCMKWSDVVLVKRYTNEMIQIIKSKPVLRFYQCARLKNANFPFRVYCTIPRTNVMTRRT
jgi:hypothetical protein